MRVVEHEDRLVAPDVNVLAVEESKIIVVASDWPELLIPDDLGRDVRIVGIDQRERLAGDVAD